MKRRFRLMVTWLCVFSVLFGLLPGTVLNAETLNSNDELTWPNPGAIQLTKKATPSVGKQGEWEITLTVEGMNLKSGSSDVVLVIDKSGSMNSSRLSKAKEAAKKFVDNLLIESSETRIAVVAFNDSHQTVIGFTGKDQKEQLKQAIEGIKANDGTNIQAGLYRARTLLTESQAQNKAIVLLSDGEPTYSYKASSAAAHTWPDNKYKFLLSKFDYRESIGSGDDYELSFFEQYAVKGYKVKDNGIGTLSEAKSTIDAGINIYSIGLEVENNSNADYVLKNIQNKGYYPSDSSDLNKIFAELASKLAFAAENAIVTDPMGDMFNLQMKGSTISESDYKASQGTVSWNANTETFTWNVGNIVEKTPATLTYKVYMDQSKNPDPNKLYPTNKKTTMNYTDANKQPTAKDFEVPLVSYGKGSILVKGYKVNANGDPINSKGETVGRPDLAEQLYSGYFKVDDKESLDIGKTYSVPAPKVQNHDLKVGTNPTSVELTMSKPSPTLWFGFIDAPSKLTIVHRAGDKVLENSSVDKALGESVEVGSKTFPGYQFTDVVVSEGSGLKVSDGRVTGVMPGKDVTITFNYTSSTQSVTVKYLEKDTNKPLTKAIVIEGITDQTVKLSAVEVTGYSVVEPGKVDYKFTAEANQEHIFYYKANIQSVTVKYIEKVTGKELATATAQPGVTGQMIRLNAAEVTGYIPEIQSEDYVFTAEANQEHIFYYTAGPQSVTVKYLENGTNKELVQAKTVRGVVGETITVDAATVAGFTPLKANDSYTFTAKANQEYIFYYTAEKRTVTVKYLEKDTNKVLEKESTLDGVTGEKVTLEAKHVPGYKPVNKEYEYTFEVEGNEYIFYYTAEKRTVTVKYLEKDTNKVLEKESTLDGVTGETVTLEAKHVPGYKPVNKEYEYTFVVEGNEYIFYYTKDDPIVEKRTVFVHYVDRESNKVLKESTHFTDKVGTSITLTAEDITFSNVKYQPENYSHNHTVINEAEQQYTFYYNKVNQGEDYRVTVNYVEQATKAVLQEPTFHTGKAGGVLELKADRISVSDAVYSPLNSNYSYKITDSIEQQYTFYYTKELGDVQSLTVKHLERGTNAELKPPSLEKGKLGASILIKPTPITSVTGAVYNPEHPSYDHTFTSEPNQVLSIYYIKDASQIEHQVTVKYLEQGTGRKLAEPTTKSGIAGKTVILNAVTVSGYTPVKSSNTYTFTNGKGQEYIFYYTAEKRTVTVKYLEKDTNKVLEKELTLDGVTGEKVKLEAKQVPGYKPVNKEYEYTFEVEGNEYIFYYTKDLGDMQSLTVKHLERGTNAELKPPSLEKGKLGESILIKPTPITSVTGAVYNPEQPSYEHTFTSKPNEELSIYYTKDASQTEHQVTVKYLEQGTGRQLAEPTTKSGIAGKTVILNAVTVSGYTPVKSSNTYIFTNGKGQEYIFYYTRIVNPDTGSPGGSSGGSSGGGSSYVAPTSPLKPPSEPPKLEKKAHYNYINGYPDGMIKPENLISREEVAAIFYRLMESQTRINYMSDKHSYSDVAGKRWSNKHISTMENAGIIKGYLDGTFNPGRSITRAEFAAIASRFDKLDGQSNTTFTDVSGHWAEKYIVSAANKGWIKGYTDRTFKPNQYITRAEAMAFINSVLDRKVKVDGIHKDAKKWPDNTPNSWYYRDVLEATNYHEYKRLEDGSEKWDQVNPDIIYP